MALIFLKTKQKAAQEWTQDIIYWKVSSKNIKYANFILTYVYLSNAVRFKHKPWALPVTRAVSPTQFFQHKSQQRPGIKYSSHYIISNEIHWSTEPEEQ